MSLSAKQQKVLDFIRHYSREQGYPPSVREICTGLKLKIHFHGARLPGTAGAKGMHPEGSGPPARH